MHMVQSVYESISYLISLFSWSLLSSKSQCAQWSIKSFTVKRALFGHLCVCVSTIRYSATYSAILTKCWKTGSKWNLSYFYEQTNSRNMGILPYSSNANDMEIDPLGIVFAFSDGHKIPPIALCSAPKSIWFHTEYFQCQRDQD